MRNEARDYDEIERPTTEELIGDVNTVLSLGVMGLW